MKKKWIVILLIGLIAFWLIPTLVGITTARAANGYEIHWWTIDGGGGKSAGGDYALQGTIGQPDAGAAEGGEYGLQGGFWVQGILTIYDFIIHLPLILK